MTKTKLLSLITRLNLLLWASFFASFWSLGYTQKDGHIFAKSLGTWADGAAHLTFVSALSSHLFPSQLPIYWGKPFIYPFAADILSAFLVRFGLDLFTSYTLVGLALSLLLVFLIKIYFDRFTSDPLASLLGLNIFLLSGGLGFALFIRDLFRNGLNTLTAIPHEYTRLDPDHIQWLNVITGELIPQRALLLGLIVGLTILIFLWHLHNHHRPPAPLYVITGILIGLLPVIHPHTLIALSPVIIWVFILNFRRQPLSSWAFLIAPAAALALPLIFFHILPATETSFLHWYPGWLARSMDIDWLWFWFLNWGAFAPLALFGLLCLSRRQLLFLAPFGLVFIISNLVLFQPYDWDNSKVITWVYLVFSPVAGLFLARLFRYHWQAKLAAALLLLVLTASGFIDLARQLEPHTTIHMYTPEELDLAAWVKTATNPQSVFLTSDLHTHPLPALTGRQIIMGYRGWLWTYGLDYSTREQDIQAIYQGTDATPSLIGQYPIDYILIGPHERSNLHANQTYFNQNFPVAYQSQNYTIYKVSPDLKLP